jgi:hypothetical protein
MTARAVQFLSAAVTGVAEINLKRFGVFTNSRGRSARLMAGSARTDISVADSSVRTVTLKTSRVRVSALRDGKRHAAPRRFVTGRAVCVPLVPGVIKTSVKTAERRKPLDAGSRVADVAHRVLVAGVELFDVTSRTGRVSGQSQRRRAAFAFVTEQAGKPRVLRIRVLKSGIVLALIFRFAHPGSLIRFIFEIIVCLRAEDEKESEDETSERKNNQFAPEPPGQCALCLVQVVFRPSVHNFY